LSLTTKDTKYTKEVKKADSRAFSFVTFVYLVFGKGFPVKNGRTGFRFSLLS
jgi:hypothetical protein